MRPAGRGHQEVKVLYSPDKRKNWPKAEAAVLFFILAKARLSMDCCQASGYILVHISGRISKGKVSPGKVDIGVMPKDVCTEVDSLRDESAPYRRTSATFQYF